MINHNSTDIKHENQFVESSSKSLLNLLWNEYLEVVCSIALLQHNATTYTRSLTITRYCLTNSLICPRNQIGSPKLGMESTTQAPLSEQSYLRSYRIFSLNRFLIAEVVKPPLHVETFS